MKKLFSAALCALALGACKPEANDASETLSGDARPSAAVDALVDIKPGPGPALWLMEDEDTRVYFFGTVHVLPPDLEWRTETFSAAFREAETVYFEADVGNEDPQLAMMVMKLGTMEPGRSLYDLLNEQEKAELIKAAEYVNIPIGSLTKLKPWYVAIIISLQQIIAEGQDPASGVEMILLPEARADGKYLRFFETPEEQLRFMADLPEQVQVDFLMEGVRQIEDVPHFIEYLDKAWVNGDIDALDELMLADQSLTAPELYEAMLAGRNRNWSDELAVLMREEAGTFMIAVGAAHLAGEDSVISMLKKGGFIVERVE